MRGKLPQDYYKGNTHIVSRVKISFYLTNVTLLNKRDILLFLDSTVYVFALTTTHAKYTTMHGYTYCLGIFTVNLIIGFIYVFALFVH